MGSKTFDEARKAVKGTPEYKEYFEANEAWWGAMHAMAAIPEYKGRKEEFKARKEAQKAEGEAWEALREAEKAVVATPEYEAYEKAGGTCKELRRGLNNGYNSYFKDNSVSDRIYRRISHSVYRA